MKSYLQEQRKRIGADIERRVKAVYSHGQFIMGPEVRELEYRLSQYIGVRHCITCASGTDALRLAALAIDARGSGIPVFSFIATADAIMGSGTAYDFVDINSDSWHGDSQIGVEIFGVPDKQCVIGDCAQSFGATIGGVQSLSMHKISCTSFFPTKPLGCYGDGGAVFTDDDDIASMIGSIKEHGKGRHKYESIRVGINSRLDTIQAAVLLAKLEIFDDELALRRNVARHYSLNLSGSVTLQKIPAGSNPAWAQFCVLAKDPAHRDRIRSALFDAGYESPIYYPVPIHLQPVYEYMGYTKGAFPVAEDVCSRVFSLPFHPYISFDDVEKVSEIIWKN